MDATPEPSYSTLRSSTNPSSSSSSSFSFAFTYPPPSSSPFDLFFHGTQYASNPRAILFQIVAPLLFCIITIIGFVGNILVIYVITSKPQMRSVTNLLLLNLAIADLTFVLIIPPVTAYDYVVPRWTLGSFACKAMHYVINVTAYVTVYTLVIVSVVRYLTVVHNAATVRVRTKRNIGLVVALTWVMMILLNLPILFSYRVYEKCDTVSYAVGQIIFTTFFVFAYLLPLSIIAVFSVCILRHIAKHRPASLDSLRSRSDARKRQASRLLILVVVVFILLWMPMHLVLLAYYYAGSRITESLAYDVISLLMQCLPYVNSCVNPFIYSHASKDFRDAFREAVSCRTTQDEFGNTSRQGTPLTRLTAQGCCLEGPPAPAKSQENGGKERGKEDALERQCSPSTTNGRPGKVEEEEQQVEMEERLVH